MFQGFTDQTLPFLWGVRLNNHRDWFLAHKQEYVDHLYEPMKAMAAQVQEEMLRIYPKRQLNLRVARIYRDVRTIHDGRLYKDHLWFVLCRPVEKDTRVPVFYFEVMPEGYEYGMGYYQAPTTLMEAFRRRVGADPAPLEKLARRLNRRKDFQLQGAEYKRPKGEVSPLLTPWYNRKSISISSFHEADQLLTSPELVGVVVEAFRWLMPFYDYFDSLHQQLQGEQGGIL